MITNTQLTHYGRVRMFNEMQRNRIPKPPTEKEERQTYYAVDMLLFIQCLMTCTYDLTKALRNAGLLRHNVKHVMKRMDELVAEVSGVAYRVFSERANLGWQYIERAAARIFHKQSFFSLNEIPALINYENL